MRAPGSGPPGVSATRAPLPRELAPGVFWIGDCLSMPWQGRVLHSYNSCYLVQGSRAAILIETGCAQQLPIITRQVDDLLARGGPPLLYIFCTHQETPHSAGLGWFLDRYPDTTAVGDVRDYHLFFPEHAGRFRTLTPGDEIDLGDTRLQIREAIIRDLPSTQWGFDTARGVLFPGDGFAYAHFHDENHCGKTAEEAVNLPIPAMTQLFAEAALYWTRFTDMELYIQRLDECVADGVTLVAPTHGLPITDLAATMPGVRAGLRGLP
jgi:flavorubredoxin